MFKNSLLALFLLFPAVSASAAEDVQAMLHAADDFRLPDRSARVEVAVTLFETGKPDKRKQYTVYLKPVRKSLILFRSAGEQGQKALQLDDLFYIMLPRTQRPVRISPLQKLLGEASVGDVSTMTWSEDYTGTVADREAVTDGTPCLKLELKALRPEVTYDKVELYLTKNRYLPVKASLYLKSGRIAKDVEYKLGTLGGREVITAMVMHDRIQVNRKTEVHYRAITAMEAPEKYYNPSYLTSNNVD